MIDKKWGGMGLDTVTMGILNEETGRDVLQSAAY